MDQQQQTSTPAAAPTAASQPTEAQTHVAPPQQSQQQQPPTTTPAAATLPRSSSATPSTPSSTPSANPNPNPDPNPIPGSSVTSTPALKPSLSPSSSQPSQAQSRTPPTTFSRPWQQHSSFSHFSSPLTTPSSSSSSSPSISSAASPSISAPQRSGIAIGVPAASHPSPSPSQPAAFSGSLGQQFGGLGRGNVPESASNSNVSQARPVQGIHGMGMMGTLGSSSQMRPSGISAHHPQRPVQSSLRPPSSPISQPSATQNFQGHSLLRISPAGSASSAPSSSQSTQSANQPWLSSGTQGRPPLAPPSYRPQLNSPSMQQRSHIPQQHHPSSTASQQQQMSSAQQQQSQPSHQPQEHFGQPFPPLRSPQSLSGPQQITRVQGSGSQKPSSLAMVQPSTIHPGAHGKTASAESEESGNRILSKRSIHELVSQIDPSEKLDAEVEDILVDIAEDFVESITTFGCSLAKHRKSDTLEAKDILIHLERNWNMTLPGFGGDEIKTYKKPLTSDIHKERLAMIKKSTFSTEAVNTKNHVGQAAVNVKSSLARTPANIVGSPNFKAREVT